MDLIKMMVTGTVLIFVLGMSEGALAKNIRATEMGSMSLEDVLAGKVGEVTVEFREGDQLPVTLSAEGDLFEAPPATATTVSVKRDFWFRVSKGSVLLSLDGTNFKDVKDALNGSLEVGAGGSQNGGAASAMNVAFKAYLK